MSNVSKMEDLIDELNQILTEYGFAMRWDEVVMWHKVGEILTHTNIRPSQLGELADILEIDEGDLWDAILFYKKFPDLNLLPEGKDVSWGKIKEKYL